jgi:hypothetical protein
MIQCYADWEKIDRIVSSIIILLVASIGWVVIDFSVYSIIGIVATIAILIKSIYDYYVTNKQLDSISDELIEILDNEIKKSKNEETIETLP